MSVLQTAPPFKGFPSLTRFNRLVVVTEKLDGCNAGVVVSDDGNEAWAVGRDGYLHGDTEADEGRRTGMKGFYVWFLAHKQELLKLGPGSHFGEWWGKGLGAKRYSTEKAFSLFNVSRWGDPETRIALGVDKFDGAVTRPACCGIVPVIWHGLAVDLDAPALLRQLEAHGSYADPGCKRPEGIVIFHAPSNQCFKYTLDKNDQHKSIAVALQQFAESENRGELSHLLDRSEPLSPAEVDALQARGDRNRQVHDIIRAAVGQEHMNENVPVEAVVARALMLAAMNPRATNGLQTSREAMVADLSARFAALAQLMLTVSLFTPDDKFNACADRLRIHLGMPGLEQELGIPPVTLYMRNKEAAGGK